MLIYEKMNKTELLVAAKQEIAKVLGAKNPKDNVTDIVNGDYAENLANGSQTIKVKTRSPEVSNSQAKRAEVLKKFDKKFKTSTRINKSDIVNTKTSTIGKISAVVNVTDKTTTEKETHNVTVSLEVKPHAYRQMSRKIEEGIANAITNVVQDRTDGGVTVVFKGKNISGTPVEFNNIVAAKRHTTTPGRGKGEFNGAKGVTRKGDVELIDKSGKSYSVSIKYGTGHAWETAQTLFSDYCEAVVTYLFDKYNTQGLVYDSRRLLPLHYDVTPSGVNTSVDVDEMLNHAVFGDDIDEGKGVIIAVYNEFKIANDVLTVNYDEDKGKNGIVEFDLKTVIQTPDQIPENIKPHLYTYHTKRRKGSGVLGGHIIQVYPGKRNGMPVSKITKLEDFYYTGNLKESYSSRLDKLRNQKIEL